MDRRRFLAAAGATLSVPVAGCLDGGLSEDDFDIGMSQNAFLPDSYEVAVGEEVVWGNNGSRKHTVTAYESGIPEGAEYFASGGYDGLATARDDWTSGGGGSIAPGETFAHTFETAGQHAYFCIPHERDGMTGVIRVSE